MWFLLTYCVLNLKVKEQRGWCKSQAGSLSSGRLQGSWGRQILHIKHELPTVSTFLLNHAVCVLTSGPWLLSCHLSRTSCHQGNRVHAAKPAFHLESSSPISLDCMLLLMCVFAARRPMWQVVPYYQ